MKRAPPLRPRSTIICPKPSASIAEFITSTSSLMTVFETLNLVARSVSDTSFDGHIMNFAASLTSRSVLWPLIAITPLYMFSAPSPCFRRPAPPPRHLPRPRRARRRRCRFRRAPSRVPQSSQPFFPRRRIRRAPPPRPRRSRSASAQRVLRAQEPLRGACPPPSRRSGAFRRSPRASRSASSFA